jgi:hypothetical protein
MDRQELEERRLVAEQEAAEFRRAVPRITLLNAPLRHHDSDGALTAEGAGELGEDRQIGVQPASYDVTSGVRINGEHEPDS